MVYTRITAILATALLLSLMLASCLLAEPGGALHAGLHLTEREGASDTDEAEEEKEEETEGSGEATDDQSEAEEGEDVVGEEDEAAEGKDAETEAEEGQAEETGKAADDLEVPEGGKESPSGEKAAGEEKSNWLEVKESGKDTEKKLVESKRTRKQRRINTWVSGLEGDRQRIHKEYGYPTGKYRQEVMGRVIEKWIYSDTGKTFIFEGSKLIDER